jgi:hypothetical protein
MGLNAMKDALDIQRFALFIAAILLAMYLIPVQVICRKANVGFADFGFGSIET